MSCQIPTYTHYNKLNSNTLFVILHGGNAGIEDPFLQKIYTKIVNSNQSYLSIQMSFKDKGENSSSGPETLREIDEVQTVLSQIDLTNYEKISFIGKSLGGLVLQRFLTTSQQFNIPKTNFTILGYLVGDVNTSEFKGNLHIIQGENDPYGKTEDVQKELDVSKANSSILDIVSGGDHSYRNDKKEPVFQDEAVSLIKT
jgi:predicted alpha/beta-hydrolase family hydrolase